jgi:L-cysteine:1D-myo-inositol 2-amino-2-deoxy-alpha-D-glucopyranoside ligase
MPMIQIPTGQALAAGLPSVVTLGGTALPLVGRARVYACGITPYDVTHLGHAATFVWVDTLARVLHADGAEVIVCRNVTDVDDVLLAAANRAGAPYDRFAAIQQFYFDRDMAALGVAQPAIQPRAHAYIGQVIALAAGLLAQGAAYERDGHVYFRGAGTAARAVPDSAAALRLAAEYGDHPDDARKDDPFDVAVWQASRDDEPAWASPWGSGRPGWHAECAAMALHAFGPAVDVQAGGGDLRFPHHAYQAALAEAMTGVTPFARARLTAGTVRVGGAKMAKSLGNLVLVTDLLRDYPAAAIRLLILDRRWDRDWDYQPSGLDAAAARLERLQAAAGRPDRAAAGHGGTAVAAAGAALANDLDVPAALGIVEEERGGQAARSIGSLLGLW